MPASKNNFTKPLKQSNVAKVNKELTTCYIPGKRKHAVNQSPVVWLSKRKDADGRPYLDKRELIAADLLYADFEKSQIERSVGQNWDRFMDQVYCHNPSSLEDARLNDIDRTGHAKERFRKAVTYLGYGLGDAVVRAVCQLHTLETLEKDMNWPVRSGKAILKIALCQLSTFYGLRKNDMNTGKIKVWRA